jgi:hypothetical protein
LQIEGVSVSESVFEFVFEGGWRWAWCGRFREHVILGEGGDWSAKFT